MIITSKQKLEILDKLVDNGMYHCNVCENYFIVRNTNEGDFNTEQCPCCGVVSEGAIEDVETE